MAGGRCNLVAAYARASVIHTSHVYDDFFFLYSLSETRPRPTVRTYNRNDTILSKTEISDIGTPKFHPSPGARARVNDGDRAAKKDTVNKADSFPGPSLIPSTASVPVLAYEKNYNNKRVLSISILVRCRPLYFFFIIS